MGFGKLVSNLWGAPQRQATNEAANRQWQAAEQSKKDLSKGYTAAGETLKSGFGGAMDTVNKGYTEAGQNVTGGFSGARQQLQQGGQEALGAMKQGFTAAQNRYDTPEMVQNMDTLFKRAQLLGGYSPEQQNLMKGDIREQYGTSMRDVGRGLSQMAGDATAQGRAAQNYVRAASEIGGKEASALRDIDVRNMELQRQEQTDAISAMTNIASQRAGLNKDEAIGVSNMIKDLAFKGADLSADEGKILGELAAKRGTDIATLQTQLASGQANLTTDEVKMLAQISSNQAGNMFAVQAAPSTGFLQSIGPAAAQAALAYATGGLSTLATKKTT